jgi:pyruvate formate lyase activating enzyme
MTAIDERDAAQPRDCAVFFRKTTFVDYPGKIAAALFFPFCNMRCPWCHNGSLITGGAENEEDAPPLTPLDEALRHIEKRRAVLEGVVLSGGDPALFSALGGLIAALKALPLAVKLDTNGTRPEALAALLASDAPPDYIAMDLKCAPRRYAEFCAGGRRDEAVGARVLESVKIVREAFEAGRVDAEFRSLALPGGVFPAEDGAEFAALVGRVPWRVRAFRPGGCLDPAWNGYAEVSAAELAAFSAALREVPGSLQGDADILYPK